MFNVEEKEKIKEDFGIIITASGIPAKGRYHDGCTEQESLVGNFTE
jgi:hypothetical protein